MNKTTVSSNESDLVITEEQPMMKDNQPALDAEGAACPIWMDKRSINEQLFCKEFLAEHPLIYTENTFFTPEGKLNDEGGLRNLILEKLTPHVVSGVAGKIESLLSLLRIKARVDDLPPQTDRVHVANGTLFLDGTFIEEKKVPVRTRLPVRYNPAAAKPEQWLRFLSGLLYDEDIPTFQEFVGYCLLPTSKAQRMMVIKGNGGEGKSQIGVVLSRMLGAYAKDCSIKKTSENQFARADLEHCLLGIDDDMCMEALRQTHYLKTITTASVKMDLERKGKQSYQGWMYARLLGFSNGDLVSLYDHSDGFFRRQLILTTKPKPDGRKDDPLMADKMCGEMEGIFLWAFEGLKQLEANDFRFKESQRIIDNRNAVRQDVNNLTDFMNSQGYIRIDRELSISSEEMMVLYQIWCKDNAEQALHQKAALSWLHANQAKFGIEYNNSVRNKAGKRVRGFQGIGRADRLPFPPED